MVKPCVHVNWKSTKTPRKIQSRLTRSETNIQASATPNRNVASARVSQVHPVSLERTRLRYAATDTSTSRENEETLFETYATRPIFEGERLPELMLRTLGQTSTKTFKENSKETFAHDGYIMDDSGVVLSRTSV